MNTFRSAALLAAAAILVAVTPYALGQVARIERVSGDRQIVVGTPAIPSPYVLKALDAQGKPASDATFMIGPPTGYGGPIFWDEFRFRGFNVSMEDVGYFVFGFPNPKYVRLTDAHGLASWQDTLPDPPSASSPIGAMDKSGTFVDTAFFTVLVKTQPEGTPAVVVEYYNSGFGNYFVTLQDNEVEALDSDQFSGWKRSTGAFVAYRSKGDAPADAVPVCRFFSAKYTSHFYTADLNECDEVVAKWPDVWTLETRNAFYIQEPDKTTGQCKGGLQPIYRMYNNRPSPNHRYITDVKLRDVMKAAGWLAEGFGPQSVMLCTAA